MSLHENELIKKGLSFHQSGDFIKARACYEDILAQNPSHQMALFFLASLHSQQNEFSKANSHIHKLLDLNPKHVDGLKLGFDLALKLSNSELAIVLMEQLVSVEGETVLYCQILSGLMLGQKMWEKAAYYLEKSFNDKAPTDFENMIYCLNQLGRFDEAIQWACRGEKLFKQSAAIKVNKAFAHKSLGDSIDEKKTLEEALQADPQNSLVLNNLGVFYLESGQPQLARDYFKKSFNLNPKDASPICYEALSFLEEGDSQQAFESFDRAIIIQQNHPQTHLNRALAKFRLGDESAWEDYDFRLLMDEYSYVKYYAQPLWKGEPLKWRKLLVHGEQGLAEEFTFFCALQFLKDQSCEVIVECEERLVSLLKRTFPFCKVYPRSKNILDSKFINDKTIHFQTPVGSLLRYLKPSQKPYFDGVILKPDSEIKFDLGAPKKIGISWRSQFKNNRVDSQNRNRGAIDLNLWKDLFDIEGCSYFNIQYGNIKDDLNSISADQLQKLHTPDFDLTNDIENLAAYISQLDMVITVNTAVAFLAASLGKPVWVLTDYAQLAYCPESFDDPLFFKEMSFMRQKKAGDWTELMERIKAKLLVP